MRRATMALAALMVTWSAPAAAQEDAGDTVTWRTDTAFTAPAGRLEIGLFSPTRYALTDTVELQTDLLLNAVLPNLGVQVNWAEVAGWTVGSRHVVRYPTLLLDAVAAEGVGGLLPANITAPQMIELDNEVLGSTRMGLESILTVNLGVSFAPRFTDGVTPSGSLPVIDFPFIYQRTAATAGGATLRGGVAWASRITGALEYTLDVDLFFNPAVFASPALEQGGEVAWRASEHFSLAAGYRLTFAEYAYGARLHVMPTLDVRGGF
jgi:hypothetical protein